LNENIKNQRLNNNGSFKLDYSSIAAFSNSKKEINFFF
jgi:hypothetical protein